MTHRTSGVIAMAFADAQVTLGAACAWPCHGYDCTGRDVLEAPARLVLGTKQRDNFAGFIQGTLMREQPPITASDAEMETLTFIPSLKGDDLQFLQQVWREVESR